MKERTRYQESRERLSRRVMYILRHYLQKIPQKKVEEGGWIKIDTLREYGVTIKHAGAIALGRGRGEGGKIRFGTKLVTERERANGAFPTLWC